MLRPYHPAATEAASKKLPPLPLRLLRRILIGGSHTIGEHVLIAGNHCGEMAEWLDELGFDVDAIDDSTERMAATKKCGARFEIHFSNLVDGDSDGSSDGLFDLIITDELVLHRDNLLCLKSRLATAHLLSLLKPHGEFVVVREPGLGMPHDATCWTRHLACFPGRLESVEYPIPWFSRETWTWLTGRGHLEHFLSVSLRAPAERLTELEWSQHARRGLLSGNATCCSKAQVAQPLRVA
jgi:hypothetical protein